MFPYRRIVFWEPCLSPHTDDLIHRLAESLPTVQVLRCAERDLPESRKLLGWELRTREESCVSTFVCPSGEEIHRLVLKDIRGTLHILGGISQHRMLLEAMRRITEHACDFGVMSEPRVVEGILGKVRLAQSILFERVVRRQSKFFLAIGAHGPRWFRLLGVEDQRIFPFAYFIDATEPPYMEPSPGGVDSANLNVVYVGRIIRKKGVFDLVNAFSYLPNRVSLSFVGSGDDEVSVRKLCNKRGVPARFFGVLPMREVKRVLIDSDVLVLGSTTTDDGWGVVVSEALMCGTAVVASSCVGASAILNYPMLGRVVPPGRPRDISQAILDLERSKELSPDARSCRREFACAILSAKAGAAYLRDIIRFIATGEMCPRFLFDVSRLKV